MDPVRLTPSQIGQLQAFAGQFQPVGQTYDGTFYTDPNTQYINIDGLRFFLSGPNPNLGPSRVDGFHLDLGGNAWAQYDLGGQFLFKYQGSNTWNEFMTVAAMAAAPFVPNLYAAALGDTAAATTAASNGFVFNAAADSQAANVLIEAGAPGFETFGGNALAGYTSAGAPLTASAAASLPSLPSVPAGGSALSSLASTLSKGVGAIAATLAGGSAARPGQVQPSSLNNTTPAGSTIGGIPVPVLIAGLALFALAS